MYSVYWVFSRTLLQYYSPKLSSSHTVLTAVRSRRTKIFRECYSNWTLKKEDSKFLICFHNANKEWRFIRSMFVDNIWHDWFIKQETGRFQVFYILYKRQVILFKNSKTLRPLMIQFRYHISTSVRFSTVLFWSCSYNIYIAPFSENSTF